MNASLRIQIIADAHAARAQLRGLQGELRVISKIIQSQGKASVSAARMAKAQNQVAASSSRATKAQHDAAAAAARAGRAYQQQAAAAARTATAQNNTAASAHRVEAAQSRAAAAHSRAAVAANSAAASSARLAGAQDATAAASSRAANAARFASTAFLAMAGSAGAALAATAALGRTLSLFVTLPLLILGGLGIKWALDYERALTRLRKVYNGTNREIEFLEQGFRILSDRFGVHRDQVAEIGATWAQAGATGLELAKSVELTIKAMTLGELDAETATRGLITIMGAYKLTADELADAVAQLNIVENETAVTTQDLIEVIADAGGIARQSGVSIRELAAMAASLVPVAGSASEAGNALKTIIARISTPTKAAARALAGFGIDVEGAAFQTATFTEKLFQIGPAWESLGQAAKLAFARDVFGLRQGNRGIVLLDDLLDQFGRYQKALDSTADQTKVLALTQKELDAVLESNPRRLAIATNQLRNLLIDAVLPLIPALVAVVEWIAKMARAFANLDPSTQKLIIGIIGVTAVVAPLLFIFSSLILKAVVVGQALFAIIAPLGALVGALSLPVVAVLALIAVLGALAFVFREELAAAAHGAVNQITDLFSQLVPVFSEIMKTVMTIVNGGLRLMPESFANALRAVVTIVASAARAVFSWLQWMNPFARHSPSLVENVQAGTKVIGEEYEAAASSVAGSMGQIETSLDRLTRSLDAQKAAVDRAKDALADLRDVVADLDAQIAASQGRLRDWLSTPVAGTFAFEDAIFSNDQAQKALRLQIALLEQAFLSEGKTVDELRATLEAQRDALLGLADATDIADGAMANSGLTADEITTKMARLQAEIEGLRGREMDLRLAGAGSDVLGGIQEQIDGADQARRDLAGLLGDGSTGPGSELVSDADIARLEEIDRLLEQLAGLELEGEILNLEEALALDSARKAIKDTQRVAEQSLDTILAGIAEETALMAELTIQRDRATAAVEAQELVVEQLTDAYEALRDATKAAGAAASALPTGDFDLPTGTGAGALGATPFDQAEFEQWLAEQQALLNESFGDFNPFGAVTDRLNEFRDSVEGFFGGLADRISSKADGIKNAITQPFRDAWNDLGLEGAFNAVWDPFEEHVLAAVRNAWADIEEELAPFREAFENATKVVREKWDEFGQPGLDWIVDRVTEFLGILRDMWLQGWEGLMQIQGHIIEAIGNIISGWITMITGLINVFIGVLTGDWDRLWKGLGQIVEGAVEWITGLLGGFVHVAWDIVTTGFEQVWAGVTEVWNVWGKPIFEGMMGWLENTFLGKITSVKDSIVGTFQAIPDAIGSAMGSIGSKVAGGLNSAIDVINGFGRGVNNVASTLGIGFRVPSIGRVHAAPGLATGGRLPESEVGAGFVTDGARAIVGEGSRTHPEFVIPTDPKHRSRALALAQSLMGTIGLKAGGKIPQFATGGVLTDIWNRMIGNVHGLWDDTQANARGAMNNIGGMGGAFGRGVLNSMISSIGGRINDWISDWFEKETARFIRSLADLVGLGGAVDSLLGGSSGSKGFATTSGLKSAPTRGGSASRVFEQGGIMPHIYSLMNGAIVRGNRGGILAHIGDGRSDELVQPLDGSNSGARQVTNNFYGDLIFPNVTDGDDVEKFLLNLESLAEAS